MRGSFERVMRRDHGTGKESLVGLAKKEPA